MKVTIIDWERHAKTKKEWPNERFDWTGQDTIPSKRDPDGHWKRYMVLLSPLFGIVAITGALAIAEPTAAKGIINGIFPIFKPTAPVQSQP